MTVRVIDSVMGSGKTTFIIDEMNKVKDKPYLYVTPLVTECERIEENTGYVLSVNSERKKVFGLKTKLELANELITMGNSLAITHSLFEKFTPDMVALLQEGGYHMVIDETVSSILPVSMSAHEVRVLRNEGMIKETKIGNGCTLVEWNPDVEINDTRIGWTYKRFFDNNYEVYLTPQNNLVAWSLPPRIYSAVAAATLLTYNFEMTDMEGYFKFHGIEYDVLSLHNGQLTTFKYESGVKYKGLVNIVDSKINEIGRKKQGMRADPLGKGWYLNADKSKLDTLRSNTYNFFKNMTQTPSANNMWTVFEVAQFVEYYEDNLGGKYDRPTEKFKNIKKAIEKPPFKSVGRLTSGMDQDSLEYKRKQCFVPCNSRATNLYSDRKSLAYLVNLRLSPSLHLFFNSIGVRISDDVFALNALIQWVWRSAIRKGEPITIYIPSERMRKLFMEWLGYEEDEMY